MRFMSGRPAAWRLSRAGCGNAITTCIGSYGFWGSIAESRWRSVRARIRSSCCLGLLGRLVRDRWSRLRQSVRAGRGDAGRGQLAVRLELEMDEHVGRHRNGRRDELLGLRALARTSAPGFDPVERTSCRRYRAARFSWARMGDSAESIRHKARQTFSSNAAWRRARVSDSSRFNAVTLIQAIAASTTPRQSKKADQSGQVRRMGFS